MILAYTIRMNPWPMAHAHTVKGLINANATSHRLHIDSSMIDDMNRKVVRNGGKKSVAICLSHS
jgi:hypothetical protein